MCTTATAVSKAVSITNSVQIPTLDWYKSCPVQLNQIVFIR